MTLDEIIAEMQRKPDAQILLEWIDLQLDLPDRIHDVIEAYFDAQDES